MNELEYCDRIDRKYFGWVYGTVESKNEDRDDLIIKVSNPFKSEISISIIPKLNETYRKRPLFIENLSIDKPRDFLLNNIFVSNDIYNIVCLNDNNDGPYLIPMEINLSQLLDLQKKCCEFNSHLEDFYYEGSRSFYVGQKCKFQAYGIDRDENLTSPRNVEDWEVNKYTWYYDPLSFESNAIKVDEDTIDNLVSQIKPSEEKVYDLLNHYKIVNKNEESKNRRQRNKKILGFPAKFVRDSETFFK